MGLGGIALYKNDPPGRTIYDSGQHHLRVPERREDVVHAERIPSARHAGGNQYIYVYGTKGAVDLMAGSPP